jgi:hypothetical protein
MPNRPLLLLLALPWTWDLGRSQEPAPAAAVTCRPCASDGRSDCSRHGKGWLERERAVRFCSVAHACKACAGVLEVDCRQCRNEAAEQQLAGRLQLVQQWRDSLRTTIDAWHRGEPLLHLQTDHVDLSFGIERLTVGRDKLDAHAAMHLYGERIEALRALFVQMLELGEADFSTRLRVYVCRDLEASVALSPRVTGFGGNVGVGTKLLGKDAVYCMWHNLRELPDDEALHRNVVHNVTHLLVANMAPAAYFGNPGNGWIDEGIAHWFEDRIGGKCTNFCFEEVLLVGANTFKGGRWRAPVRRMCDAGELTSLAALAGKNTDQLTFPEHAQSFAMIDCLVAVHGGSKLRDFVRSIKGGTAMRDAMQAVYGTSPLAFDAEFQTWVKANYSPEEPPR